MKNLVQSQVVIVGSGLGGLGCALSLWRKGFKDFTILEREKKLGGRTSSEMRSSGQIFDYGANYMNFEGLSEEEIGEVEDSLQYLSVKEQSTNIVKPLYILDKDDRIEASTKKQDLKMNFRGGI